MVLRLSSFPSDVRAVVLTGLSTATSAAVAATDTVLVALGKLQAQLASYAPLASPTFTGTATTPALTVSGGALELGSTSGTATAAYVDFHSSGFANDYDARVIASGGTSSNAQASLSVYATSVSFSSGITATGAGISASTGVNRWLNILSGTSSRWNIGSNAASENSTTLATSAAQAAAGTVLTFTATTGVTVGMLVKGTSIPAGATVSAVTSTSVTLSAATTAAVASGASLFFYANTGSDLSFNRYNDDGTLLQTSTLQISRATGKATFNGQLWAGQGIGTGAGVGPSFAGAAQGSYLGWNYTGGTGEMDFINSRGGGAGGFNFYNITTSTTATMTLLASINGAGVFNTARVFAATTGSSINDTNVQVQIDTAATGQAFFGANKAGTYGLLVGYNGSAAQIRQVTTDPLQIVVNNTVTAAQFNSDKSAAFYGAVAVTGALTAPTPAASDNSANVATTAWVKAQTASGVTDASLLGLISTAGNRTAKTTGVPASYVGVATLGETGVGYLYKTSAGAIGQSIPAVTISGGGGTGATALAIMGQIYLEDGVTYGPNASSVVGVLFTSLGSSYTSTPTITIAAPTIPTGATQYLSNPQYNTVVPGSGTTNPTLVLWPHSTSSAPNTTQYVATATGKVVNQNVALLQTWINNRIVAPGVGQNPWDGWGSGGRIRFPASANPYWFDSTITVHLDQIGWQPAGATMPGIEIIGDGQYSTSLATMNLGNNPLFVVNAVPGAGYQVAPGYGPFRMADLQITGELNQTTLTAPNTGHVGVLAYDLYYASFENLTVAGFGIALDLEDPCNLTFTNVSCLSNLCGVFCGFKTSAASPNALTFVGCNLTNNSWWGLYGNWFGILKYMGGSIGGNGHGAWAASPGGALGGAIINDGTNSATYASNSTWGASFDSVQFESNCGDSAIYFCGSGSEAYGSNTGLMVTGCDFWRGTSGPTGSTSTYSQYCIHLVVGPGTGGTGWGSAASLPGETPTKTSVVLIGNGFWPGAGRPVSSTTPYVKVDEGGGPYNLTMFGNVWASSLEMPKLNGPTESTQALATGWGSFSVGGVANNGACPIAQSFNISGISKSQPGLYGVYFQKPMPDTNYIVTGCCVGAALTFGIYAKYTTYFLIQTTNTSGAYADGASVDFSVFGSNHLLDGS